MIRVLVKIVWGLAVIVWVGFGMWWGWNNWWKKEDRPKWKLDKTKVVRVDKEADELRNPSPQGSNLEEGKITIISKDINDFSGSSVVYTSSRPFLFNGYKGKNYFVGKFLSLKPLGKDDEEMFLLVQDKKVAFRIINNKYRKWESTKWGVEVLSRLKKVKYWSEAVEVYPKTRIVDKLKVGDVVAVVPYIEVVNKRGISAQDEQGRIIAAYVFIRRWQI